MNDKAHTVRVKDVMKKDFGRIDGIATIDDAL